MLEVCPSTSIIKALEDQIVMDTTHLFTDKGLEFLSLIDIETTITARMVTEVGHKTTIYRWVKRT